MTSIHTMSKYMYEHKKAKMRYDLHTEDILGEDSSLVLMKFPALRSPLETSADLIHLDIKPKSMKFKLDVDLDPSCKSFCKERAQALGNQAVPNTFANGIVDKNFYTSNKAPNDDRQLFACRVVNNKLVCRPVSHILTMRSDLTHLDLKDEVDPKEEVRPVSVKFAAPVRPTTTAKANTDLQQETDDSVDDYKRLIYKPPLSKDANFERNNLFGQRLPKVKPDPDAEIQVDTKPIIFTHDVKPKIERMDLDDIYSSGTSQNSPKKLNVIKQKVKDCLLKAKIVSFEEIHNYVRTQDGPGNRIPINNKDILDALNEFALLVQGNWAIKSEVLYGDSSERDCTDVTGVSINLFIAARDYLLLLFTQNRLVSRLEYSRIVRLPDYDILELFNQLATFRQEIKRWELKLPTNDKFLEKFPDIVQRQATFWKVRKANKLSIFKMLNS